MNLFLGTCSHTLSTAALESVQLCEGSRSSGVTGELGGGILPGAFAPSEFPSLICPEGPLLCLCPHFIVFLVSDIQATRVFPPFFGQQPGQKGPKDMLASKNFFFPGFETQSTQEEAALSL